MEKLDGLHWETVIHRPEHHVEIIQGVLQAVISVHARGVAHNDLKDSAFMLRVTKDGKKVVLVDFNISTPVDFGPIWLRGTEGWYLALRRFATPM